MLDRDHKGSQELSVGRRTALRFSGAALALAFASRIPGLRVEEAHAQVGAVDLGAGDTGVLNYAYALEQLEAAFYSQVVSTPYGSMTSAERRILTDIRDHEIAHRNFLKDALGANAIPDLVPNFGAIDFRSRSSVLTTARTFENLGVAAYNGGGQYIQNVDYLLLAGKIVSVEARHAAIITDLLEPMSANSVGADVVTLGLDGADDPSTVLGAAAPFISTRVTANQLP